MQKLKVAAAIKQKYLVNQKICDRRIFHNGHHWKRVIFKHESISIRVPHLFLAANATIHTCTHAIDKSIP